MNGGILLLYGWIMSNINFIYLLYLTWQDLNIPGVWLLSGVYLNSFPNESIRLILWSLLEGPQGDVQYIPRNMHTVFALLCFVVVIHWLIFPYPSGLLHCHCGNLTIAPVPAKQPWLVWINTSCEFIMNDCITTTKQSTTKPCAYFLGYTVGKAKPRPCPLKCPMF